MARAKEKNGIYLLSVLWNSFMTSFLLEREAQCTNLLAFARFAPKPKQSQPLLSLSGPKGIPAATFYKRVAVGDMELATTCVVLTKKIRRTISP